MAITIPRAEIEAIGKRFGVLDYGLDTDPPVEWVRRTVANYRRAAAAGDPLNLLAEAADLEALAARYEHHEHRRAA